MNPGFVFLQKYLMTPMAKISQFKIVRAVMAAGMASVPFSICFWFSIRYRRPLLV